MHVVYSCYFANLNLLLFSVLNAVAVVVAFKSSLILLQSAALRRGGAL